MSRTTKLALIAIAMAVTGATAYAAKDGPNNDALAITNAKTSLTQAVTAAEQHANGKAVSAEFENAKQGWLYEVEVVSGTQVFEVKVDAETGTVLSSVEDKVDQDDHDGHHDKRDKRD